MNRIYAPSKLVILALILLFVMTGMEAAEGLSSLSGKVVDVEGNPVAGFALAIQPVQFRDGFLVPVRDGFLVPAEGFPAILPKGETDSEGTFTISDIQPGPVQLIALPDMPMDPYETADPETFQAEGAMSPEFIHNPFELEADKEIISIQIGKLTFFSIEYAFFGGLTFALEPGRILEDVKVTVKSRLRIRGRVLYADGTPLANAQARLRMKYRHEFHPNHGGTIGTSLFTDADGYFTYYPEKQGFYALSVQYETFSAGAGPFLLKEGMQPEVILLTLEEPPYSVKSSSDNIKFRQPPTPAKSVWIINPTNGHAYKRIQCENYHDAQRKAVAEGAHLVSINDGTEQHWLNVIFTHKPFWIGLSDAEKEGEWQWDSGEPVTYTNWVTYPAFQDRLPDSERDYVVSGPSMEGGWQSAGPESPLWRMARWAVIEKDGLVSTTSRIPEKAADK